MVMIPTEAALKMTYTNIFQWLKIHNQVECNGVNISDRFAPQCECHNTIHLNSIAKFNIQRRR